ncbi:MAG: hypothetical protein ABI877_08655 [Gemmatimonadaceae bacterium]
MSLGIGMHLSTAMVAVGATTLLGILIARQFDRGNPYAGLVAAPREVIYPGELRVTSLHRVGTDSIALTFANLGESDSLLLEDQSGAQRSAPRKGASSVAALSTDTTRLTLHTVGRPAAVRLRLFSTSGGDYRSAGLYGAAAGTVSMVSTDIPFGGDRAVYESGPT